MSAEDRPRMPMRRGLRILLVVSLALNLAVVGLAIGAAVKWQKEGPPRSVDLAGGPLAQALSRDDRRAISEAMRQSRDVRFPSRQERREMTAQIAAVLRAEPFERDALESLLESMAGRVATVRQTASDLVLDRIEAMTPAERAAMADALERGDRRDR